MALTQLSQAYASSRQQTLVQQEQGAEAQRRLAAFLQSPVRLGTAAVGAFHGFKRNGGSVGWALAWAAGAFLAGPLVTGVLVLAQGFGKKA